MQKNIFFNSIKHFKLITKHRWIVFKLCCKAGIPLVGLVHDLSKYSPVEFIESIKFYNGNISPLLVAKRKNGYSKAWLHHKGRNKHHVEYWYDPMYKFGKPIIPYKYTVEMICDNIAAGMVYKGKRWRNNTQLIYWNKIKDDMPINEKNKNMITEAFTQISINGVNEVIKKEKLQKLYKKYCK